MNFKWTTYDEKNPGRVILEYNGIVVGSIDRYFMQDLEEMENTLEQLENEVKEQEDRFNKLENEKYEKKEEIRELENEVKELQKIKDLYEEITKKEEK